MIIPTNSHFGVENLVGSSKYAYFRTERTFQSCFPPIVSAETPLFVVVIMVFVLFFVVRIWRPSHVFVVLWPQTHHSGRHLKREKKPKRSRKMER
jgi:hypothetical protein